MSEREEIKGWVAGRVPADWYQGTPDVSVDNEEMGYGRIPGHVQLHKKVARGAAR